MYTIQALNGPSNNDSQAYGLNSAGDVAGVFFGAGIAGAIWSGGSSPSFSMPANSESILYAINDGDRAVGVRGFYNSPTEIAILVAGNVVKDLSALVGNGSIATGINNAGRVCGWGWNDPRAFVYDAATNSVVAFIDPLPGSSRAVATKINQLGQVAGLSDNRGFVFNNGPLIDLGAAAFVEDMNESSKVSGSVGKPWPEAFSPGIWDISGASPAFTEIPVPPGFLGGHACGINNKGDVVGTCWTPQTYNVSPSAYIYSGGISTDLNTLLAAGSGWHLEFAEQINEKGQISGIGQLNGNETAFLLTPESPFAHIGVPDLVAILILGGVIYGGSGSVILPGGGPPIPVGPWERTWATLPPAKRDALIGLALDELAQHVDNRAARESIRRATLEAVRASVDQLIATAHTGKAMTMMAERRTVQLSSGKVATGLARFGGERAK